jgi:hypothetical protein
MTSKTISQLQSDACFLHAMAQGVDALFDTISTELSPASNAMPAMFQSLIERADRLAQDLDAMESEMRQAGRTAL